jgi:predicted nuclease of predicted toxin-antitoxin system
VNVLADESLDRPVVEQLRLDGHDVVYVAELAPGIPDDEVLRQANARGALLITGDKDFGELVYRMKKVSAGVLLVRLGGLSVNEKARIVADAMKNHGAQFVGAFSVIDPGSIRIRRPT